MCKPPRTATISNPKSRFTTPRNCTPTSPHVPKPIAIQTPPTVQPMVENEQPVSVVVIGTSVQPTSKAGSRLTPKTMSTDVSILSSYRLIYSAVYLSRFVLQAMRTTPCEVSKRAEDSLERAESTPDKKTEATPSKKASQNLAQSPSAPEDINNINTAKILKIDRVKSHKKGASDKSSIGRCLFLRFNQISNFSTGHAADTPAFRIPWFFASTKSSIFWAVSNISGKAEKNS